MSRHDSNWPRRSALAVGVLSLAMYAATCAPGVHWGDAVEFVSVARTWGVAHPPGYPVYSLVAGAVAHVTGAAAPLAVNLLSALFVALGLSITAWTIAVVAGRGPWAALAGALAALGLATGRAMWSSAVVAEVYGLHLAIIAAIAALCLSDDDDFSGRRGWMAAGLVGLGLAHHPLILCVTPLAAVAVWRSRPRRPLPILAALLLPLLAYLYLPLASRADPPFDWGDPATVTNVSHHVTCRQYAHLTTPRTPAFIWQVARGAARSLPDELPLPLLALSPIGLWAVWRRSRAAAIALTATLAISTVVGAAAAAALNPPYFIPVWWLIGLCGGAGLARLLAREGHIRWLGMAAAAWLVVAAGLLARDNLPVCNQHANDLPARYARAIMAQLPPDALVLPYSDSVSTLLQSARLIDGLRPDVDVVSVGDLWAVGSCEVLRRNFPRVVLPNGGFRMSAWPWSVPGTRRATSVTELAREIMALNADRRPVLFEFAPGMDWAAPHALPFGHLLRLAPDTPAAIAATDLQAHERMLAALPPAGVSDPGAGRVFALADNSLGWYWLARGDAVRAETAFKRALRDDPLDPATHANIAILYAQMDRPGDARRHFDTAADLAPWDAMVASNRATFLDSVGETEAARRERLRAARLAGAL